MNIAQLRDQLAILNERAQRLNRTLTQALDNWHGASPDTPTTQGQTPRAAGMRGELEAELSELFELLNLCEVQADAILEIIPGADIKADCTASEASRRAARIMP